MEPRKEFSQAQGKTKILFIGPYPPPYAGPEVAMRTLLRSSLSKAYDICLLKTNFRRSNAEKGKIDLVTMGAILLFFLHLTLRLLLIRPRLVYYFVTATRTGWLGRDVWCILLTRFLGAKVVTHSRAGHFRHNYEEFGSLGRRLVKFACSLVSLSFVQGKGLRKQFAGLIDDGRIVEVYNAIDDKAYSNERLGEYDQCMILFLGHLSFAKGYCDILKIIPTVAKEYPNVCFCFAGTKVARERNVQHNQITGQRLIFEDPDECYEQYVRGKYDKNYSFLGIVDEYDKISLLKRCSFLILPSYSEGLPMAVVEALTMGKPVVCTPVGALREIIQNGISGFLVSPGNIAQLNEAVCKLLSSRQLRDRIARQNYHYARELFSQDSIARRLSYHFDRLIAQG